MFYKNEEKILSLKIKKYITLLTLAIWIMDDGTFTNAGVRISCNPFTLKEVTFLYKILKKIFIWIVLFKKFI